MKPERLDKLLAAQSTISRKEVKAMIKQGRVCVNDAPARAGEQKIDAERDRVTLDGRPVRLQPHVYLMLDKPAGVVSATRDTRERTVLDLVPEQLRRGGLFPAGRLDKDTTGFVLLTDDGDFAHRILAPKSHVPKTYLARLDLPVDEGILRAFEEGFALNLNTDCKPARLTVLESGERELVQVVLIEGMYHQIKRMFAHFGRQVLELRRVAMGALPLDEALGAGNCRALTEQEVALLACRLPGEDGQTQK